MAGWRRRPRPGSRASSLPLVPDSIQAETLAANHEDSSRGALPPPRSFWGPKEDSVLAQGYAPARTEREEQRLQRLRENLEAAIEEAPNLARWLATAQGLLEEEFSKWMANQEEDATKRDEMNPWKDEADPSCPDSSGNLSKEEPMIIQEGGLKDRKQDDAYFSSFSYDEVDEMDMANLEEKVGYTAEEFQSKNLPSIEEEEDEGYCTAENKNCRDAKPIIGKGQDKDIDGQCSSDSVKCKDPIKNRFTENLENVGYKGFAQQEKTRTSVCLTCV